MQSAESPAIEAWVASPLRLAVIEIPKRDGAKAAVRWCISASSQAGAASARDCELAVDFQRVCAEIPAIYGGCEVGVVTTAPSLP